MMLLFGRKLSFEPSSVGVGTWTVGQVAFMDFSRACKAPGAVGLYLRRGPLGGVTDQLPPLPPAMACGRGTLRRWKGSLRCF